ncbi:hypothetical protein DID96_11535 [Burkholderia sp. Bp8963]|nr:hypothetical protein [Burkholderia sp. Bp8963]RQS72040.1 hypothetical protein DID96_11535 [Burkholderia sp. Bp8963]
MMPADSYAVGIVWQIDAATVDPVGNWQWLGASDLLVQWIVVDDTAFVRNTGLRTAAHLPDWDRISREPWAKNVILGLAGDTDERRARTNFARLGEISAALVRMPTPLHVTGYYFPVEIDPSWTDAPRLVPVLNELPRPLWVTVYDRANVGGDTLGRWLASWLPADVGVFFQDGCGVNARIPPVARNYLDALSHHLGKDRVRVVAEAFRPAVHGGFRAATADELRAQMSAYSGYSVYLFDGPHYVSDDLARALAPQRAAPPGPSR